MAVADLQILKCKQFKKADFLRQLVEKEACIVLVKQLYFFILPF